MTQVATDGAGRDGAQVGEGVARPRPRGQPWQVVHFPGKRTARAGTRAHRRRNKRQKNGARKTGSSLSTPIFLSHIFLSLCFIPLAAATAEPRFLFLYFAWQPELKLC